MRIIAGTWRSRRLITADTEATRPMPDRVKESIFNKLGSYYGSPGALPPLRVADVFSGSGSMGLEALSRGAEHCTFFEHHPQCLAALKTNFSAMKVGPAAEVVRGDAWRKAVAAPNGGRFELIFLDPPFRESADTTLEGPVRQYLARLKAQGYSELLVVFHHETSAHFEVVAEDGWTVQDERRFGRNSVTFLTP